MVLFSTKIGTWGRGRFAPLKNYITVFAEVYGLMGKQCVHFPSLVREIILNGQRLVLILVLLLI
jgi:hypothetical protein